MRYHNITKDDMLNGDGLRVVLWVAGCGHHCKGCQNPITWDPNGGIPFDDAAKAEIFDIKGICKKGRLLVCMGILGGFICRKKESVFY